MIRILLSIALVTSSLFASAQNRTVFFNDSIVPAYKLMSASINSKTNSKKFELTLRNGKTNPFDFSDIHSLRFYALTKEPVTLTINCFAGQQQSTPIKYELKGEQSGYNTESFPIPTSTIDNAIFNYKAITALEITVIGNNETLIDEFTFLYSEDTVIITGPESLNPLLKDKEVGFREEKAKENNSEFFRRKKEFENR